MTGVGSPLARFRRACAGAVSVEFAFILPLLLTLYLGGVDVTRAVVFHKKLQQTTAAINNLVTQTPKADKAKLTEIFTVANAMLAGYDMADFKGRVTSVAVDANGKATVDWAFSKGMPIAARGQAYALPKSMGAVRGATLLVIETAHSYTPLLTYVLPGKIAMDSIAFGRSRTRTNVSCSDC